MTDYLERITEILKRVEEEEAESLEKAAHAVAEVIKSDGIIFAFGCGHSHIPSLEGFYRAGGLANVSPILDDDLMLHNGAAKSSRLEKKSGIADEIFRRYAPTKKDMIFVFSASGKNAVPVEMAKAAKAAGVLCVGVSSSEYKDKGGVLPDIADIYVDCKAPYGDACITVGDAKMGGLSTYAACFIFNRCLIEGAKKALNGGVVPPVYKSGNIEGGKEYNLALEEKYFGRVKNL